MILPFVINVLCKILCSNPFWYLITHISSSPKLHISVNTNHKIQYNPIDLIKILSEQCIFNIPFTYHQKVCMQLCMYVFV
ncbi:hypothetical protein Hanom_Chr05g00407571 [Helianthus anomalus]